MPPPGSPPLYSQDPRSEPEDSSVDDRGDDEDDDGFVKRSRRRSISGTPPPTSPPSKRARISLDSDTPPMRGVGLNNNNGNSLNGSSSKQHTHDPSIPAELAVSILNVEPLDEFIREIADFVYSHIRNANVQGSVQVELEAKLGILRDRRTGDRLTLPTLVETILHPSFDEFTFESNLSVDQHKKFNHMLNKLMTDPPPRAPKIKYEHLYLVDEFHPIEGRQERKREKIRVTRDEKTQRVVECVNKVRLGDLNIYSPKRNVDWRISVNLEIPERLPSTAPDKTRKKNRISYSQEISRIDLTQVMMQESPLAQPVTLHELELELTPSSLLLQLAHERDSDRPVDGRLTFDEAIRVFVNNVRILVKNA